MRSERRNANKTLHRTGASLGCSVIVADAGVPTLFTRRSVSLSFAQETKSLAMQPPRLQHFGLTLLLSFGVVAAGFFVDQAFRWTEVLHGLFNGIVYSFVFAFSWVIIFLPWCLAVYYIWRWRHWTRFRTHFALAPSVCVLGITMGSLIFQPPTPQRRLKHFAQAEIPLSATGLRYFFSGGGLADYSDTYSFTCSPAETDQIIAQMPLVSCNTYNFG